MTKTVNIPGMTSEALESVETELSSNLRRIDKLQHLLSLPVPNKQIAQEIVEQARSLLADIAASLDLVGGAFTE